jgi:hypothetical protein
MVSEDLRYKIHIICYEERSIMSEAGNRSGSRRTSRRFGTRWSGLSAHLTTAFWVFLCGASLSYRSMQNLTTKSRTWSRRWRRWWAPLTGTPWRRPPRNSGLGLCLSLLLMAISFKFIGYLGSQYVPQKIFFCLVFSKIDDFQLCCEIF